MSSLRLALKQSLEETVSSNAMAVTGSHAVAAGGSTPASEPPTTTTGTGPWQDNERRGPGRPRKHGKRRRPIQTYEQDDRPSSSDENEFFSEDEEEIDHRAANKIQARWKKGKGILPKNTNQALTDKRHETVQDGSRKESLSTSSADSTTSKVAVLKSEAANTATRIKQPHSSEPQTSTTANPHSALPQSHQRAPLSQTRQKPHAQVSANSSGNDAKQTVPAPDSAMLHWSRALPLKRARRAVAPGMRVKVRFSASVQRAGGVIVPKRRWFGGRVTKVSKEGSKVRIKYDDGTSEITKFPDKDIVVDEAHNGSHTVPVDEFLPLMLEDLESRVPDAVLSEPTVSNREPQQRPTASPVPSSTGAYKDPTVLQKTGDEIIPTESPITLGNDLEKTITGAVEPMALEETLESEEISVPSRALLHDERLDVPPKRKRGRPPKHRTTAEDEEDVAEIANPMQTETNLSEQSTVGTVLPFEAFSRAGVSDNAKPISETTEKPKSSLTIRISNVKREGRGHMDRCSSATASRSEIAQQSTDNMGSPPSKMLAPPEERPVTDPPAPKRLHIHISSVKSQSADKSQSIEKSHDKDLVDSTTTSAASPSTHEAMEISESASVESLTDRQSSKLKHIQASSSAEKSESMKYANQPKSGIEETQTNEDPGSNFAAETERRSLPHFTKEELISTEDLSTVARSGRRAAQQANERIASKQESNVAEQASKKRKKRGSEQYGSVDVEDDSQWVQCDKCGKWRIIPSAAVATLPKQWYCSDNIWDVKRSTCEAVEQSLKQVAKEKAKEKRRKKRQRLILQAAASAEGGEAKGADSAIVEEPVGFQQSSRARDDTDAEAKSKRFSPSMQSPHSDTGSDTNPKDKKSGGMGKKGQNASEDTLNALVESAEIKGKRGRPRRNGLNVKPNQVSNATNQDEADNLEWVQCEKCDKWRKLPPHISADELPEVWYCNMNKWNPSSASCDAPEDKSDGQQDVGMGSSGFGNKLSYRYLIFGPTGRNVRRPISERTRAVESIFATPCEEGDVPTVMYANSSNFVSRTKAGLLGEDGSTSVLGLMNNSHLWVELRDAAESYNGFGKGIGAGQKRLRHFKSYESFSSGMKESIKDLLLQALSNKSLTGDEVLSDAMNRDWDKVPKGWVAVRDYCSINVVVMALCDLVREGVLEVLQDMGPKWTLNQWIPRYRRAKSYSNATVTQDQPKTDEAPRCIKISKPWKHRGSD
jgi:hypothetical protein